MIFPIVYSDGPASFYPGISAALYLFLIGGRHVETRLPGLYLVDLTTSGQELFDCLTHADFLSM